MSSAVWPAAWSTVGFSTPSSSFATLPPVRSLPASIISTTGMLLGLVVGPPLVAVLHSAVALLMATFAAWVLASLGWRLGSVKGRQVVAAAGLSRILAPPPSPPQGHALLVDSSALMDRFLLVLGRGGLLPAGLILPQFVIDHVRSVAEVSDPVTSRRARRGLESIEALREMGVPVHVPPTRSPRLTTPPSSCSPSPAGWDCASAPVPPLSPTKPCVGNCG